MKTIKGPGIFLAQFMSSEVPFNTLENACAWAASLQFKAVQLPTWDVRYIDLQKAAESIDYAQEIKGKAEAAGIQISELSSHLQGQLVAVHPSFDAHFDGFAPKEIRGNAQARTEWAAQQLKFAARASRNLGLTAHATFSGALIWQHFYPWPPRDKQIVAASFAELAKRWLPILNEFDACGVDLCYEIHPGEDLHDGITFERFLKATNHHPRVKMLYDPSHLLLQQMNYLEYIDIYHEYISMFHVKDAEFNPNGRSGVYGGYQDWIDRPGRFRSLGDGQVNFKSIFSKLAQYDYSGWAVLEWECCLKNQLDGAREGADFIKKNIIIVAEKSFDDFAAG